MSLLRSTGTPLRRANSSISAGHLLALGDEDAGQVEAEERGQRLPPLLGRQRVEIGDLGLAQHVQPVGGEAAGVAGQRQARAGHLGLRNLPVEAQVAGERLELEGITAPGEEVAEPQHQSGLSAWVDRVRRAVGGALDLAPELLLGPVECGAVVGAFALGHENLAARNVQPQLDRLLDPVARRRPPSSPSDGTPGCPAAPRP